jgi:heavy-metal resistance protein CzcE
MGDALLRALRASAQLCLNIERSLCMTKRFKTLTMGSALAAAMAAAAPGWTWDKTDLDRTGTPMQGAISNGPMIVQPAPAATIGEPMVVQPAPSATVVERAPVPNTVIVEPSPSASNQVVTRAALGPVDRTMVLGPDTHAINVNWGETVRFVVPNASGTEQQFAWRFDGTADKVNLADIAPSIPGASNVAIYVNQALNPLHENDYSSFPSS